MLSIVVILTIKMFNRYTTGSAYWRKHGTSELITQAIYCKTNRNNNHGNLCDMKLINGATPVPGPIIINGTLLSDGS